MNAFPTSTRFCIGGWDAAPDLNSFFRDGRVVRVEPKVMELCVRLARSGGVVVTKDELLDSVWPNVVVGEDALTRAVSELRRALDDDARNPRVIETIPKRGYRLIVPVTEIEIAASMPEPSPDRSRQVSVGAVAATAAILLALVAIGWWTRPWVGLGGSAGDRPALVLVAEFENATGQPELAATTRAVVEEAISRSGRLAPMPAQRTAAVLARMRRSAGAPADVDTAHEVAARDTDVSGIVTGRLARSAGELTLSLQLWSGGSQPIGHLVARGTTEASLTRAIADRSEAFERLERRPADQRRPLPPVTTSSLAALKLFAHAVDLVDAQYASITGPWDTAIELLRESLKLDPDFGMASVWLAMVVEVAELGRLSYVGGDREHRPLVKALAEDGLRQTAGLSDAERLFITGAALKLLGRTEQAIAALDALLQTGSGLFELRTRVLLGALFYSMGRWADYGGQAVALAEMRPGDFDANATAAHALVLQDRNMSRAAPYASRARDLMTAAAVQRENSCWLAAWIEHLPVYESWQAGDLDSVVAAQQALAASLPGQTSYLRDALATANGHFWLSIGRVSEARHAFELVGHKGQLELNLSALADLRADRPALIAHLEAMGWSHSAAALALAGMLDRADEVLRNGTASEPERLLVRGLQATAAGRTSEGTSLLQQAVDLWRGDSGRHFYGASLALADAWAAAGDPLQVIRVLEEAASARPSYSPPGLQAAPWIKVQVRLVQEYRRVGRTLLAADLERKVRGLLAQADPDHPFLAKLDVPASPKAVSLPSP